MKWIDLLAPICVIALIVYEYIMNHKQYKEECEEVKENLEKEYAEKVAEYEEAKEDVNKLIANLSKDKLERLQRDYDRMQKLHGKEIKLRLEDDYTPYVTIKLEFKKWFKGDKNSPYKEDRRGYWQTFSYEIDCNDYYDNELKENIIKAIQDKYNEMEKQYQEMAKGKK